jgi:hypothetical protein
VILAALATGATAAEAAAIAKVSVRTVRRRLSDESFRLQVTDARREVLDSAIAKVSASSVSAVQTLTSLLELAQPPSVRLGAAKAVLDFGIRLRSEREIQERLTAIEEHLATIERSENEKSIFKS